jgi:drug/metabolite transporter (DMT)-like permease
MTSPVATGLFGLASATSWGAGDFSGGLATRRAPVFTVAGVAKSASFVAMVICGLGWAEPFPSRAALAWGGAAGLGGALGLLCLYQGLALGTMSIVAPLSAIIAACIPAGFAALYQGLPSGWQAAGFGLAFLGVWFVSAPDKPAAPGQNAASIDEGRKTTGLILAVLAGLGFGTFYICISRARTAGVFWTLAATQFTTLLVVLAAACGAALFRHRTTGLPTARVVLLPLFLLMVLAGLLDAGGNTFFVLAEHAGRLDVAAVLASLYPASTVVLARTLLKEHVSRRQALGVAAALVSIPLIAG